MKKVKKRLEAAIEQAFLKKMKKAFPHLRAPKMNIMGQRSWPDRMIPLIKGHTLWIEFKRPGEVPTPLQEDCHNYLRRLGHDIQVFDDDKVAFQYLSERMSRIGRGLE